MLAQHTVIYPKHKSLGTRTETELLNTPVGRMATKSRRRAVEPHRHDLTTQ